MVTKITTVGAKAEVPEPCEAADGQRDRRVMMGAGKTAL